MPGLVLTRREGESIEVSGPCRITVNYTRPTQVSLLIEADREVTVMRSELVEKSSIQYSSPRCLPSNP